MHREVLLIGVVVGCANFMFRYLPLRFAARQTGSEKRGLLGVLLDTIGIASICALLVVSFMPDVLSHPRDWLPALFGFVVLAAGFARTRSVIFPTLLSAVGYGLIWKLMTLL